MNSRILPLVALLASIGIFFGYVNPVWSGSIAAAKAGIASDNAALVAAAQYAAHENELATARSAISQENLDRLAIFLPDSVDNVRLILDLNALAARSEVSLANIDVAKSAANTANAPVPGGLSVANASVVGSADLSLSIVGTYEAFQTFLNGLEMSGRLLDVRDIAVSGSDTGIYSYKMSLRLYWLH